MCSKNLDKFDVHGKSKHRKIYFDFFCRFFDDQKNYDNHQRKINLQFLRDYFFHFFCVIFTKKILDFFAKSFSLNVRQMLK